MNGLYLNTGLLLYEKNSNCKEKLSPESDLFSMGLTYVVGTKYEVKI